MQGFLTIDGQEIYTDGFDSMAQLLQEVYSCKPAQSDLSIVG